MSNVPDPSRIEGFTFTNGNATGAWPLHCGGGLYLDNSSPTITGNSVGDRGWGGGLHLYDSSPAITNTTISGNSADMYGGGLLLYDSSPIITGTTISGNEAYSAGGGLSVYSSSLYSSSLTISNSIIAFSTSGGGIHRDSGTVTVSYSNVHGNVGGDYVGMDEPNGASGNMSGDPLFADAAGGDFHLRSLGGRWDPVTESWVMDGEHSPCIDAGDPAADWANEPDPNGGRVNMGRWGNTAQASKSAPPAPTVTAIAPDSGTNDGSLSVTITGTGFRAGAEARLTRTGQPDINGTALAVVSDTEITCNFDLDGAEVGEWDVVVANDDGKSGQLDDGFRVELGIPRAPGQAGIAARNVSTTLEVNWQDNSADEDGFEIERRRWLPTETWSAWTPITVTGPNVTQYVDNQVPVGSSYQYRVRAFNAAGASQWATSTGTRCEPSPIWPIGLQAQLSAEGTSVDLSWVDRSDYEDQQKVQRRRQHDNPGGWSDWTTIAWVGADTTAHADSALPDEGRYQYRVQAFRGLGESEYSPVSEVLVSAVDPVPAAPANARIATISDSRSLRVTWQDSSVNEEGFEIERRRWLPTETWSAWTPVTATGPDVTQYVDNQVPVGSSYQYRVRAFNAAGHSDWATSIGVRCEPTPIWPIGLQAVVSGDGTAVDLSWVDRSDYEDQQKVQRRHQVGPESWSGWTTIAWVGANATSCRDSALPGVGLYQYRVQAFRGVGESEYSPIAQVQFGGVGGGQVAALVSSMNVQQVGGQAVSVVYSLSADADVTLEVRNIAGRVVATVPVGTAASGVNTATWNLRNTAGAPVPSGMYLCAIVVYGEEGSRSSAVRTVSVQR